MSLKSVEKEIIAHTELVKAKEMEGNGKGRYFSLISTYSVGFIYQTTR